MHPLACSGCWFMPDGGFRREYCFIWPQGETGIARERLFGCGVVRWHSLGVGCFCKGAITDGAEFLHRPKMILDSVSSVSVDRIHSAAVKTDGSLYMWGNNKLGQLGNGESYDGYATATPLRDVSAASVGAMYSGAVKTDGSLWMWGSNDSGVLGDGSGSGLQKSPERVIDSASAVILGSTTSAAIKNDRSLWVWGRNNYGQVGTGADNVNQYSAPVKVLDSVSTADLSGFYSAAVRSDGSLWTWGNNKFGQLGDGTTTNASSPKKVLSDVSAVALGGSHSAAIKTDGSLWTWGYNKYGQLGDGTTENKTQPVKVLEGVSSVSLGEEHSAAVKKDGTLWMWGSCDGYELGDAFPTTLGSYQSKPVQVFLPIDAATIESIPTQTHTGKALNPKPVVKLGDTMLTEGRTTRYRMRTTWMSARVR